MPCGCGEGRLVLVCILKRRKKRRRRESCRRDIVVDDDTLMKRRMGVGREPKWVTGSAVEEY